jgi:hypothetical protein
MDHSFSPVARDYPFRLFSPPHLWHAKPLAKLELAKYLPTQIHRLHEWYTKDLASNNTYFGVLIKYSNFYNSPNVVLLDFKDTFKIYQCNALDISLLN